MSTGGILDLADNAPLIEAGGGTGPGVFSKAGFRDSRERVEDVIALSMIERARRAGRSRAERCR